MCFMFTLCVCLFLNKCKRIHRRVPNSYREELSFFHGRHSRILHRLVEVMGRLIYEINFLYIDFVLYDNLKIYVMCHLNWLRITWIFFILFFG